MTFHSNISTQNCNLRSVSNDNLYYICYPYKPHGKSRDNCTEEHKYHPLEYTQGGKCQFQTGFHFITPYKCAICSSKHPYWTHINKIQVFNQIYQNWNKFEYKKFVDALFKKQLEIKPHFLSLLWSTDAEIRASTFLDSFTEHNISFVGNALMQQWKQLKFLQYQLLSRINFGFGCSSEGNLKNFQVKFQNQT